MDRRPDPGPGSGGLVPRPGPAAGSAGGLNALTLGPGGRGDPDLPSRPDPGHRAAGRDPAHLVSRAGRPDRLQEAPAQALRVPDPLEALALPPGQVPRLS